MGTLSLGLKCHNCKCKNKKDINPFLDSESADSFTVSLEWLSKDRVIEKLKNTKCPKCGSDDFFFTDEAFR